MPVSLHGFLQSRLPLSSDFVCHMASSRVNNAEGS